MISTAVGHNGSRTGRLGGFSSAVATEGSETVLLHLGGTAHGCSAHTVAVQVRCLIGHNRSIFDVVQNLNALRCKEQSQSNILL